MQKHFIWYQFTPASFIEKDTKIKKKGGEKKGGGRGRGKQQFPDKKHTYDSVDGSCPESLSQEVYKYTLLY